MCLEQTKVTEWIISGNPEQYNVVDAFHNLHRVDWAQKANMTVGDIVYIYISGNVKAIKFKCRVNKANLDRILMIENMIFQVSLMVRLAAIWN